MSEFLPVVLVHGIRLSGAAWTMVADRIADTHPVIAVDLPGHGRRRGEKFTLAAAAETVTAAIDSVGGRAVVVGHSLGGYVSIAAAAAAPDAVAGLVVAGSTCVPSRSLMLPFSVMHRVLSRQSDGGQRTSARLFDAMLPEPVAVAVSGAGIATEVIPDVVAELGRFDVLGALGSHPGPVWLINGRHDHLRVHERRFVRACRAGRLSVVPRAGHYLPLADPERFVDIVLEAATGAEQLHRRSRNPTSGNCSCTTSTFVARTTPGTKSADCVTR
ncbi:alpha/beta fold hydrolase [Nocardia sp. NPDC087230]|jgi:pimeloyl-ACP methyl ester carboxylesterase|uniref:alpha/beta fold hydrolase n=1 Tax=Nocardia sp. NPDC087230 TaxID=3364331 RepID=UPI0037F6986F